MKKERMKGFAAGLIACVLVMGLIGTAAATVGKRTVDVDYTNIKIELNGKQITPTDANGNIVEPFAISGTTYLPVRAVSNALGLQVGWDGTTNTVQLTEVGEKDGGTNDNESYLQLLEVMDEYKTVEDKAEQGLDESKMLSREISGSFSKYADISDIRNYLIESADYVKQYGETIAANRSDVEKMVNTSKTDYVKANLENVVVLYDKLATGQQNLTLAYDYGIAYLDNPTDNNWDSYFDYRKKADDCFDEVLTSSLKYYEVRNKLMGMLGK